MKPDTQRRKNSVARHTLPKKISKGDSKLLRHMFNLGDLRLNIKEYSKASNIPRSTIYDALKRLEGKGLINKINTGNFRITTIGKQYINGLGGVGLLRRECRDSANLSTHYLKFILPISDRSKFNETQIPYLNPKNYRALKLKNLQQHYIYFDDATIIINPKKVYIHIHDLIGDDVEISLLDGFNKALEYCTKLDYLNIKYDKILLENSHYARIDSVLGDFLSKVDKRYFLDLGEGRKLWIDNSTGPVEDETNDKDVRDRLDTFLSDVVNSDSLISDIDKIKEVLGFLTKLETMRFKDTIKPSVDLGTPDYFG